VYLRIYFQPQSTASQFTAHGHRRLKAQLRPNELFILFRNNHFRHFHRILDLVLLFLILFLSVGFKRGDQIYLLETDISFRATPECWSLPGLLSCVFVGEDFLPVEHAQSHSPPHDGHHNNLGHQHPQHHTAPSPPFHQLNSHHVQPLNQQHERMGVPSSGHIQYTGRPLSIEEVQLLETTV
jgi:hypothetical protein